MAVNSDYEVIAQQLSAVSTRLEKVEARLAELEPVVAGLERAALTTARALQQISQHWDAVYDAMQRVEALGEEAAPDGK